MNGSNILKGGALYVLISVALFFVAFSVYYYLQHTKPVVIEFLATEEIISKMKFIKEEKEELKKLNVDLHIHAVDKMRSGLILIGISIAFKTGLSKTGEELDEMIEDVVRSGEYKSYDLTAHTYELMIKTEPRNLQEQPEMHVFYKGKNFNIIKDGGFDYSKHEILRIYKEYLSAREEHIEN